VLVILFFGRDKKFLILLILLVFVLMARFLLGFEEYFNSQDGYFELTPLFFVLILLSRSRLLESIYFAVKSRNLRSSLLVVYIFVLVYWVINVESLRDTSLTNGLYVYFIGAFLVLQYKNVNKNICIFLIVFSSLMLFIMSNRVALISFLLFVYFFILDKKSILINRFSYLAVFSFMVILSVIYANGYFDFLDEISLRIFGKSIDSGRIDIWNSLWSYTERQNFSYFFGYSDWQPSEHIYLLELNRNLSAHNTFLELFLQYGVSGFLLFLAIHFVILSKDSRVLSIYGRFSSSIILSSLPIFFSYSFLFYGLSFFSTLYIIFINIGYLEKYDKF
jgi:O-antigen ligase